MKFCKHDARVPGRFLTFLSLQRAIPGVEKWIFITRKRLIRHGPVVKSLVFQDETRHFNPNAWDIFSSIPLPLSYCSLFVVV